MSAVQLSERDLLLTMAAASESGFGFIRPLLSAAMDGLIELHLLRRGASWPDQELRQATLPVLVLLGDDDLHHSAGPSTWTCAGDLRRWSRGFMINGAWGSHDHYAHAVEQCLKVGRYALIECNGSHLPVWFDFMAEASPPVPMDLVLPQPAAR